MAELNCVVWNCCGLKATSSTTPDKLLLFEKHCKKDFHVAIFTETHKNDNDARPSELNRYQNTHHIIESPRNDLELFTGITILIHKDYNIIKQTVAITGRIINIQIENEINKIKYNIIAIYNYTLNKLNSKTVTLVTDAIKSVIDPNGNNILTGDFNFVENDLDRSGKLFEKDKQATNAWNREMAEIDLIDPFRQKYPNKKMWSFISKSYNTGSRIDRVYVTENISKNIIKYKHINVGRISDHRILTFSIKSKIEIGKSYWKMDTSILKDKKYKEEIKQLLREMENLNEQDAHRWWDIFLTCVKSISMTYTSSKNWIRKNLKRSITNNMERLEQTKNFQNNETYLHLKQEMKIIIQNEIEHYKRKVRYQTEFEDNRVANT